MCRLVAYLGAPAPLHTLVFGGDHSLHRQSWAARELRTGSVNVDGYGVVWPGGPEGGLVRLARLEPTWHDPDLPGTLGAIRAPAGLAALRNASPGLPVDRAGLLPLLRAGRALAMNGFVPRFRDAHMRALRAPLSDRWYAELRGVSDAETLFLRVLQEIEGGALPDRALLTVRAAVAERVDEWTPLTLVLMGVEGITAIHGALGGPPNSLYLGVETSLAPAGVLLASEPLDGGDTWEAVPGDSVVKLRSEGVSVEPIPGA